MLQPVIRVTMMIAMVRSLLLVATLVWFTVTPVLAQTVHYYGKDGQPQGSARDLGGTTYYYGSDGQPVSGVSEVWPGGALDGDGR